MSDISDQRKYYERMMDEIAAEHQKQLDQLRGENAKLREENERFIIKLNAEHIVRQNVESENAKLRELAGYMIRCMQEHHNCVDCLVNGEQCDISCIESDLWELGIEVEP